jgi:hypothetical protein
LSPRFKGTSNGDGKKEPRPNPRKWRAHSKHATSQEKKAIMDKRAISCGLKVDIKRFTKVTKKKSKNTSKDATKGNGTSQPQKEVQGINKKMCVAHK